MAEDDLAILREEEKWALREFVRLGYIMMDPDGKPVTIDAGIRRTTSMVWSSAQRRALRR
jgi:hypothetical protein